MTRRLLIALCAAAAVAGCSGGKANDDSSGPSPILWELA